MIPIRKLHRKLAHGALEYTFVFPAAYDTIQVFMKWTNHAADGSKTGKLAFYAVDKGHDANQILLGVEGIGTGLDSHDNGLGEKNIIMFDWKAPAMKAVLTQTAGVGADGVSVDLYVKTFSYGLENANSTTLYSTGQDNNWSGAGTSGFGNPAGTLTEGQT